MKDGDGERIIAELDGKVRGFCADLRVSVVEAADLFTIDSHCRSYRQACSSVTRDAERTADVAGHGRTFVPGRFAGLDVSQDIFVGSCPHANRSSRCSRL